MDECHPPARGRRTHPAFHQTGAREPHQEAGEKVGGHPGSELRKVEKDAEHCAGAPAREDEEKVADSLLSHGSPLPQHCLRALLQCR